MSKQHIRQVLPEVLRQLGYRHLKRDDTDIIIPPLCSIPAGAFLMGSDPVHDPAAWSLELPQHQIIIPEFYIAKYPLTVAEYACAVSAGGVTAPTGRYGDEWMNWEAQVRAPAYPAVALRWADALAYVGWLSAMTGDRWRLPTEAEWEKAARGTDGRIYPWGNVFDSGKANTDEAGIGRSTPVYTYSHSASPYGVVDLIGNVHEWCSSAWYPYPYDPLDGREDLRADCTNRIARGGSCIDTANNARAATRWPLHVQTGGPVPQGTRLVRD